MFITCRKKRKMKKERKKKRKRKKREKRKEKKKGRKRERKESVLITIMNISKDAIHPNFFRNTIAFYS